MVTNTDGIYNNSFLKGGIKGIFFVFDDCFKAKKLAVFFLFHRRAISNLAISI